MTVFHLINVQNYSEGSGQRETPATFWGTSGDLRAHQSPTFAMACGFPCTLGRFTEVVPPLDTNQHYLCTVFFTMTAVKNQVMVLIIYLLKLTKADNRLS